MRILGRLERGVRGRGENLFDAIDPVSRTVEGEHSRLGVLAAICVLCFVGDNRLPFL